MAGRRLRRCRLWAVLETTMAATALNDVIISVILGFVFLCMDKSTSAGVIWALIIILQIILWRRSLYHKVGSTEALSNWSSTRVKLHGNLLWRFLASWSEYFLWGRRSSFSSILFLWVEVDHCWPPEEVPVQHSGGPPQHRLFPL